MFRIIADVILLFAPIVIGPWVFIVLSLFFVLIVRNPIEVVPIGIILNSLYYFGDNIFLDNWMLIMAALLYMLDLFISERVIWKKII